MHVRASSHNYYSEYIPTTSTTLTLNVKSEASVALVDDIVQIKAHKQYDWDTDPSLRRFFHAKCRSIMCLRTFYKVLILESVKQVFSGVIGVDFVVDITTCTVVEAC